MLTMALGAFVGLIALLGLYFFFSSRSASLRKEAVAQLEEEATLKSTKSREIDDELVNSLVEGTPMDQALAEYQRSRAAILPGENRTNPSAWTVEDLEAWRKRELRRRLEEVNGKVFFPSIASFLFVILITVVGLVVYYQFMAKHVQSAGPTLPHGHNLPVPVPNPSSPTNSPSPSHP